MTNLYSAFNVFLDIKTMHAAALHEYSRKLCRERDDLSLKIKAIQDELQHRNRRSPTEAR